MIEKNKTYTTEITGVGEKGEGIGRIEGFAVFIPYALMGETVEVLIVKVLKNYAFGKIVNILKPSPERIKPKCPVFYQCGGCDYHHCTYEMELQNKTNKVRDCIQRIGGLDIKVADTLGSTKMHYRNKSQFPVTPDGIGFYAPRSHRVIPVDNCLIQHEKSNRVIEIVKQFMTDFHVKPYDEATGKGVIRHIFTRCTLTNQMMICIVTASKDLKNADSLVSMLKTEFGENISVMQNINSKNTNVILGKENILLWGEATVTDKIGDLYFEISPQSFFQINPEQTKVLYDKVKELADLKGDEKVLDLYCGIGTIGLYLAENAKTVTGVEIVPEAIENAKRNALLNGIKNAEFHVGSSEDLAENFKDADVIIIDPPRKGCDEKLLKTIDEISPKKVVYVSCNPATLARDLKILDGYGYKADTVCPVDMFPRTSHVETCVLLSKLKSSKSVSIELDLGDLEITAAEAKATYGEIKEYILNKYGFKVSSLNIAQVKQECGIIERENFNKPSGKYRQPKCPEHKFNVIKETLEHFKMI